MTTLHAGTQGGAYGCAGVGVVGAVHVSIRSLNMIVLDFQGCCFFCWTRQAAVEFRRYEILNERIADAGFASTWLQQEQCVLG